jgi:mRNA interferase YafQ
VKEIKTTNRFLRDLKLARRRGQDLDKLEAVIAALARGEKLSSRYRPHRLQGEMKGLWECHVEPDWLLIWDEMPDAIILIRSGTHSDLFD